LISLVRQGERTLDSTFLAGTPSQIIEHAPTLLLPYVDLAASIAADWYDNLDLAANFRVSEVSGVDGSRIAYTAKWAFNAAGEEPPLNRMVGAFQRMVFDAARTVVVSNAKAEGLHWFRDAREDACSFCRLLTVNPRAYRGKYVDMPSHNHDCRCLAVVQRGDTPYAEPPWVARWRREVSQSVSGDLTSTLATMDEHGV